MTTAYGSYSGLFVQAEKVSIFVFVHPVGSITKCYYNPKDPMRIVFNFDQNVGAIVGEVVGGVFMIVALTLIFTGIYYFV